MCHFNLDSICVKMYLHLKVLTRFLTHLSFQPGLCAMIYHHLIFFRRLLGRLRRLPYYTVPALVVLERPNGGGHQGLNRDQLAYNIAIILRRIVNNGGRTLSYVKQRALTVSRITRRNSTLSAALRQPPGLTVSNWV